tara:strand:+ start:50 stop:418 length:369 start_codon:yes stop_codon:yes gene_type:complete
MAVTYTQYLGGTKVTKSVKGGNYKKEPYTVHKLNAVNTIIDVVGTKNFISKVKCAGTVSDWVKVDLYDLKGNLIIGQIAIDESDEITGPFGKVVYSSNQQINGVSQATTEPITALVWEKQNG